MANLQSVDVAVVGAAGGTGTPLVQALARRGARVRALVHRPEQAQNVPDAAEIVAVDIDDATGLAKALDGAKVVHFIPPVFNPAEERYGAQVLAAAAAAGVPRATYHSVLHAPTPAMPHHHRKSRVELLFRESALVWTIFQPAMYAQTPLFFFNPEANLLSPGFNVGKPFTPIDREDLSEAVAIVLTEAGHDYATYELAGADRLDFTAMAAAISAVTGRKITAQAADPQVLVAGAIASGRLGPATAVELAAMLAHYEAHGLLGNSNTLAMILGRAPTPFIETMRRELAD